MEQIKIVLDEGAYMPERAHDTDAGFDLRSPIDEYVPPKGWKGIKTGVHIELPKGGEDWGYYGRLASKSGLNVKNHIVSEGVIDTGYTGEITVMLYNHGDCGYHIRKGDKITQLIIERYFAPEFVQVEELSESERGSNGFGSTGR